MINLDISNNPLQLQREEIAFRQSNIRQLDIENAQFSRRIQEGMIDDDSSVSQFSFYGDENYKIMSDEMREMIADTRQDIADRRATQVEKLREAQQALQITQGGGGGGGGGMGQQALRPAKKTQQGTGLQPANQHHQQPLIQAQLGEEEKEEE